MIRLGHLETIMTKKLVFFILGTVLLSSAWMGIVSSVKGSQDVAYTESLPLKFSVVQSKWERLLNFNPIKEGRVQKPADFVFTLGALDLDFVDYKGASESLKADVADFKNAYIDAGRKAPFFTVSTVHGNHLVRALKEGENLKLVGFSLDSVLNFLGTRLENNEWFLLDGKNRILAARQGAYVGRPYSFDGEVQKFKFEQNKHRFTFAIVRPQGASLAVVNFLGVLGIVLIALALFMYKEIPSLEIEKDVQTAADTGVFDPSLELDQNVTMKETDFVGERDLEEDVEDIQMINLQKETVATSKHLDYSEFLIDNPVLQPEKSNPQGSAKETEIVSAETEPQAPEDWVKLAEELSANIDKFTQDLTKSKKSDNDEETGPVDV